LFDIALELCRVFDIDREFADTVDSVLHLDIQDSYVRLAKLGIAGLDFSGRKYSPELRTQSSKSLLLDHGIRSDIVSTGELSPSVFADSAVAGSSVVSPLDNPAL